MTVALPPLAGTCSSIIVSVLYDPPSRVVPNCLSSAFEAVSRSSLPTIRMFCAFPSMLLLPAGEWSLIAMRLMLLLKWRYVAQAQPLPNTTASDRAAAMILTPSSAPCTVARLFRRRRSAARRALRPRGSRLAGRLAYSDPAGCCRSARDGLPRRGSRCGGSSPPLDPRLESEFTHRSYGSGRWLFAQALRTR